MEYLAVLLPSVAVGLIFYFVMRAVFNADRSEREAMTRAEEELRERKGNEGLHPAADSEGRERPRE